MGTAGLFRANVGVELQDVLAGIGVNLLRRGVGQEMRQVGTDDYQRFRAAPELLEDLGDGGGPGLADRQRHQRKVVEYTLQEG